MIFLVFAPVAVLAVCPVRTISKDELTVHDVQFVGLKMIWSQYPDGVAVKGSHRGLQLRNTSILGFNVSASIDGIKSTEGNPAYTVLVDDYTWVEDGRAGCCPRCISVDHQSRKRRFPGTDRRIGFQYTYAMTAVAEVEEELFGSVLLGAPDNRWCPRDSIALVPRIRCPPGADLLRVDGAVKGPVHHVVG